MFKTVAVTIVTYSPPKISHPLSMRASFCNAKMNGIKSKHWTKLIKQWCNRNMLTTLRSERRRMIDKITSRFPNKPNPVMKQRIIASRRAELRLLKEVELVSIKSSKSIVTCALRPPVSIVKVPFYYW